MKKKFVLAGLSCLVIGSIYLIGTNKTDNRVGDQVTSVVALHKNSTKNLEQSTGEIEKESTPVDGEKARSDVMALAPVAAKSVLKQRLCHQHSEDCVADTTLNFSIELSNATGDLQTEAVGILLQSTNFNDVFTKFSTEKSLPEAFESESMLQQFVQAGIGAIPTAKEQTACSNTVCMVEVDVDSETDLTALNTIVNSEQWPMGSSVIVPVYDDQRLKFRVVTTRVHQVGTGVSIGAPK
jgi:hypothetical protein